MRRQHIVKSHKHIQFKFIAYFAFMHIDYLTAISSLESQISIRRREGNILKSRKQFQFQIISLYSRNYNVRSETRCDFTIKLNVSMSAKAYLCIESIQQ